MPEWIANRPVLLPWLNVVMMAFLVLHSRRTCGMNGANPLTMSDIDAYFRMAKISDTMYYLRMVCALDSAYMAYQAQKDGG